VCGLAPSVAPPPAATDVETAAPPGFPAHLFPAESAALPEGGFLLEA